jgi:Ca2+:H+ antiporter
MTGLDLKTRAFLLIAGGATILVLFLRAAHAGSVLIFLMSVVAMAALAAVVSEATAQLSQHLGTGVVGIVQPALGNLPELFFSIFALRAGLLTVVQATLVGSVLANSLLVLGIAFMAGGLKHGVQHFGTMRSRMNAILIVLSVAALVIPTLATSPAGPASGHAEGLSVVSAIVLLLVFAASLPSSVSWTLEMEVPSPLREKWPAWLAAVVLIAAGVAAAFVSEWMVAALVPAMAALGLSEAFTGLVIVAIAGNAVEQVAGVQMALRNHADFALSLILNSSLQIALALTPLLVIISHFIGGTHLTLVLAPLLIAALGLSALLDAFVVYDGESTWLEGAALIGLYLIIAASFWWAPRAAF